jgi:hypothetical protein
MAADYASDAKPTKASKKKDDDDICRTALDRHARWVLRERTNIDEAYEDLKFSAGEQWSKTDIDARHGRPMLTVNRLPQFIRQVTGDMRQMRPSIKVVPVDSRGDKDTAETIAGMIRYIENRSDSSAPYMTGADSQVRCGIGHFQVIKEYAGDTTFNQELRITGVSDGVAVAWDTDSVFPSREDAKWCIVPHDMSREAFKESYPDANVEDFDSTKITGSTDGWFDNDMVRVAEYWVKKPVKKLLALLPDGGITDLTDKNERERLEIGNTAKKIEERDGYQVCRYLITAAHVLETTEWPGNHIPVIPVIGEEVKIGRKVVRHGLIRFARDPQRLYNYYSSTDAEVIALQPKAPFVGTLKNVEKFEDLWNTANSKAHPILLYTPDPNNGGKAPERVQPPVSSQGIQEGLARSVDDMKAVIGIYDPGLGRPGSAKSGKAILAEQKEGDTGTYVYVDNWTRAIKRAGVIIADLIPHVYDSERMIRIMGEDGKVDLKWINKPTGMQVLDEQTGQPLDQQKIENDVTVGAYDIVMDTGPSYTTKRAEARDSMTQFVQAAPETAPVLMDLIAKAQDWPLADEVGKRLEVIAPPPVQKLIAKQKKEAGDEEQPEPPTPQEMQAQQVQQQMIQLELQNKELANEKIQAEIAEIIARTRMEQQAVGQEPAATPQEPFDPVADQTARIAHDTAAHELMHKTRMGEVEHAAAITAHQNAQADLAAKRQQIAEPEEKEILDGVNPAERRHDESLQVMAQIAQGMAQMGEGFRAGLEALAKAQAAPKKVDVSRDKSGAITGGVSSTMSH